MAEQNTVKFIKAGSLLTVEANDPRVCHLLERALFYVRKVQVRGEEARELGSNIREDPKRCFGYKQDEFGVLPRRLACASGFLPKLARILKAHGYRVMVKNLRPHKNHRVFTPQWDRLAHIDFRWRQREILKGICSFDYGRVDCCTGYGKSFMMYCLTQLLPDAKFAISTHAADVIQQIYFELSDRMSRVGLKSSKMSRSLGPRVNCYTGKSLHHCETPVDYLLVDEVHEFGTDDYMDKVSDNDNFFYARRWGFSASNEDRMDEAHFELEGLFGPIRFRVPYQEAVDHGCVVPIEVWWRDVVMDYDPSEDISDQTWKKRRGIWQNEVRNQTIAKAAREFPDDEQVLIVVETIEHAMFIKRELPEFYLCHGESGPSLIERASYIEQGCITDDEPEMTTQRRMKLKKAFESGRLKKVIATGVWERGVDFRQLQVLIRADARRSAIADTQIPGRTSRMCKETNKKSSIVIDFRDQFSKNFRDRAAFRSKNYGEKQWKQVSSEHQVHPLRERLPITCHESQRT